MPRAVSIFGSVVVALLVVLFIAVAEASAVARSAKLPAHVARHKQHQHHARDAKAPTHPPEGAFIRPSEVTASAARGADSWSSTYKMAFNMLLAFQNRNFTEAASYIDDMAFITFSAITCGNLNKAQLLAAAANDHAIARYFQIDHWAGYGGSTIGAIGSVGAIMGPGTGGLANQTEMVDEVVFYFMPNEENTALIIIEQLADISWKQPNASTYRGVWNKLTDAVNIHDRAALAALFTDDVSFVLYPAWLQGMSPVADNKTAVLDVITGQWPEQTRWNVKTHWTSVMCDVVLAYFTWSSVNVDGSAQIMKFLMSTVVTDDLKVQYLTEYSMMPLQ